MCGITGKRLIALILSFVLFAAVFVWDMPISFAEEPPVESPTAAPTETAEPEPTEIPIETPVPPEEPSEGPLPTEIPVPLETVFPQIPDDIPDDMLLPESESAAMEPCTLADGYSYEDNGDGTVTITGYYGVGGDITLPSVLGGKTVTVIGESAFSGNGTITKATIPSSVIRIQDKAFYECSNMTHAYFMGDAPNMGIDVFSKIYYPFSVYHRSDRIGFTTIWNNYLTVSCNPIFTQPYSACGFIGSSSEYDYWVSEGQVTITKYRGSSNSLKIPSQIDNHPVTAIGERAFANCEVVNLIIPSSVRIISSEAFKNSIKLMRVDILDGTKWIGSEGFSGCWMLQSVNLPSSLEVILSNSFNACGHLKDITIPKNVIGIGMQAFNNCERLSKVYFLGNAPKLGFDSIGPIEQLSVFRNCDPDFKVYYVSGNVGFTNPWNGYQTALFDINKVHIVTFNPVNGQSSIQMTVANEAEINPPLAPQLKGWEFRGWVLSGTYICHAEFPYRVCNETSFEARYIPMTANLSGVQVSAGVMSPGFIFTTKKYKIVLGENEPSIQITPLKECNGATMTINGKAVSSTTVTLANGKSKTVTIKVKYGKKSTTYKFTVTRAKSGDNNLAALTNSAGVLSQPFDPNVTNYTLNLDENTSSVTLKAAKSNSMAKVSPATKKLTLKNGQTKVLKFTIKAQSGAKKTYTVTVTRAPSTNTNLKTLKVSIPLSPGFNAGLTDYTVTLPADKAAVTISAKAFDKLSKVTINGAKKSSLKVTLANGQSTTVSVVVTSQAGTTKEYRIVIQRP